MKKDPEKNTKENNLEHLSPEQVAITQDGKTEMPFTGKYWNYKDEGNYSCVVCGQKLFVSDEKYDSGSGWPSFTAANENSVEEKPDNSIGKERTEVLCRKCGAHLGHVFPDGPKVHSGKRCKGLRYCINSASLNFNSKNEQNE